MKSLQVLIFIGALFAYCNAQAGLVPLYFVGGFNQETFCQSRRDGSYHHPLRCDAFVQCSNNRTFVTPCPVGLSYDFSNRCEYVENAKCLEIQKEEVCYGAKGNSFGTFTFKREATLIQLTLEHLDGYLSCNATDPQASSFWGCNIGILSIKIGTVVTFEDNQLLFPQFKLDDNGFYFLARTDTFSAGISLYDFSGKLKVKKGQMFRIWHGEDLKNKEENNNGGVHCVRVRASFHVNQLP